MSLVALLALIGVSNRDILLIYHMYFLNYLNTEISLHFLFILSNFIVSSQVWDIYL